MRDVVLQAREHVLRVRREREALLGRQVERASGWRCASSTTHARIAVTSDDLHREQEAARASHDPSPGARAERPQREEEEERDEGEEEDDVAAVDHALREAVEAVEERQPDARASRRARRSRPRSR